MESRRLRIPPLATWLALAALFVVPGLIIAAESALHFSGSALDGPFQLYNALRRIAAGFRPGIDFQFFHGIGVPYAHYWLFRALGGRFQDAEMARQLIAAVVFPASLFIFFRAFAHGWTRSAFLTAATIATIHALKLLPLLFALNSMVGLRSTLPSLLPVVLYRAERRTARVFGVGVMLGLSMFMSTEQGLAAMGAFVIVSVLTVSRRSERTRELVDAAITVIVGLATLFIALTSVGGVRGAMGALRYNFKLVPMDQYWFFGAPPNPFIPSWTGGVGMLVATPAIGLALALGVVAVVVYARRWWRVPVTTSARREAALTFFALYGVLSCTSLLGAFIPAYSETCWRVVISLGALELLSWADSREAIAVTPRAIPRAATVAALLIIAWVVVANRSFRSVIFRMVPHFVAQHVFSHHRFEVSGIWPETLAMDDEVMRAHATPQNAPPKIWSTYAGWLEARAGVFHPSFDYIIHPLGPENRRAYLDTFRATRPDLVQTVRPGYSVYELWVENANWDLYRELLRSYVIAAETPWSFFWERRVDSASALRSLGGGVPPQGMSEIPLPVVPADGTSRVTVLQVDLTYEVHNPLQWLPVIGPMPRYLVSVEGGRTPMPVSLDPYLSSSRFPIFAKPGQTPVLHVQPFSLLPGVSIVLRSIEVSVVPVDPRNAAWLQDLGARYGF
ncbi:MAG TPA: hypothetical protein VGQ56_08730 [Gemmatimonadaceae bacterium]|nr:hypothetical protein [Gemmatimonadaceae bacterium]